MDRRFFLKSGAVLGAAAVLSRSAVASALSGGQERAAGVVRKVVKTDAEWRRVLTPEQYRVTRLKGTEAPHSSPLNKVRGRGVFVCVCCGLPLFSTEAKYDSGTGWPSFWAPVARENVREAPDDSLGERRTTACASSSRLR